MRKARFHLDVSLKDTVTRVKRAGLFRPPAREWWQWWILCGAACSLGPPSLCAGTIRVSVFAFKPCYNDYMMAKRRKTFRRAALQLRAVAMLQRHIFIAMSIARMIFKSFAAKRVVWQRNQSNPRLFPLCDGHYHTPANLPCQSFLRKSGRITPLFLYSCP